MPQISSSTSEPMSLSLEAPTEEEKQKIEEDRVWQEMEHYLVPKKICQKRFPINPAFKRFVPPRCLSDLERYRGPYFFGASGTGKTTSATALVYEWLKMFGRQHPSFMFINYPKFIMELQDTYRGKDSAYDFLDGVAQKDLLVVDDLGAEKPTEYVRQATYYLINEREANCKATIITSNFSLDFLEENIDPRIASRIKGMCDMVELKGRDLRGKK